MKIFKHIQENQYNLNIPNTGTHFYATHWNMCLDQQLIIAFHLDQDWYQFCVKSLKICHHYVSKMITAVSTIAIHQWLVVVMLEILRMSSNLVNQYLYQEELLAVSHSYNDEDDDEIMKFPINMN